MTDPTDDAMQVISHYQNRKKPIQYAIFPTMKGDDTTPELVKQIKDLYKPVETFLGALFLISELRIACANNTRMRTRWRVSAHAIHACGRSWRNGVCCWDQNRFGGRAYILAR